LLVFVTVATNCTVEPSLTELAPLTETVTAELVGVELLDPDEPLHPANPREANPHMLSRATHTPLFVKATSTNDRTFPSRSRGLMRSVSIEI
jgi:hypothetical protein